MCGIIGYVGPRECKPLLLYGLERLEYRGYDSAGIALLEDGGLTYTVTLNEGLTFHDGTPEAHEAMKKRRQMRGS